MPQLASLNAHTTAILNVLSVDHKTFDAGAPDLNVTPGVVASGTHGWGWQGKPGESTFLPYRALYPLPGGIFYGEDLGTLGAPYDDASLVWQVTHVGATARQCEALTDNTNELLIGQPLTVPDRFVMQLYADMAGGGVRRDDEIQPPVFISSPRYRADSTPLLGGS